MDVEVAIMYMGRVCAGLPPAHLLALADRVLPMAARLPTRTLARRSRAGQKLAKDRVTMVLTVNATEV
eukprot:499856-Prorocentrum_minimum.AAC.1